jgi:hypothetical protein
MVRVLVQSPREVPLGMAKDGQRWKHSNGGVPSRGLCWVEHTALRREQLEVDDTWPIVQEMGLASVQN